MTGNPYAPEVTRTRDDEPWQNHAACNGSNPEAFFTYNANHDTQANLLAEKYCDHCPVRRQCADLARETNTAGVPFGAYGIWAGQRPGGNGGVMCPRGLHERTIGNTGRRGACLTCKNDRQREHRGYDPRPPYDPEWYPCQHPRTVENRRNNGSCRKCHLAREQQRRDQLQVAS